MALTYRVKVKVEVDVDFPGEPIAHDEVKVTIAALNEAARQAVIDLLPAAIADRCIVTAGRTAGGGLMDVDKYDGGPALIQPTLPVEEGE